MKYTGLISIAIGIIGLLAIAYFDHQLDAKYEELGSLGDLITLMTYDITTWIVLMGIEILGLLIGLVSLIRLKSKAGAVGVLICAVATVMLILQF